MAKEVRIKLTEAQRSKIKSAIGKNMTEIRVSNLGKGPAAKVATARAVARGAAPRNAAREVVMARQARAVTNARASRAEAGIEASTRAATRGDIDFA